MALPSPLLPPLPPAHRLLSVHGVDGQYRTFKRRRGEMEFDPEAYERQKADMGDDFYDPVNVRLLPLLLPPLIPPSSFLPRTSLLVRFLRSGSPGRP